MLKTEKKCSCCKELKTIDNFQKNGKYHMGKCKPCHYIYVNNENKKNKERYKKYQKISNKRCYERGKLFIDRYKSIIGCKNCGEKRYWIIDYHHLDPSTKTHPIPWYKTSPIEIIKREIRKCITLCRNCHTDFHYQEKTNNMKIEEYLKTGPVTWEHVVKEVTKVLENHNK